MNRRSRSAALALTVSLGAASVWAGSAWAVEPALAPLPMRVTPIQATAAPAKTNLGPLKISARLAWTDELVFHDWRVQRELGSGVCRLLDASDRPVASGDFNACRDRLNTLRRELDLPPPGRRVALLLHGLAKDKASMRPLAAFLRERGGYDALTMTYPSTEAPLAHHAAALARVLENLEGAEQVDLVGHSMGNMVIRHYLGDHSDPATGRQGDPRIQRIVMLGPPNQGSSLARKLGGNVVFQALVGDAGEQLGKSFETVQDKLAIPLHEFGVIAGGRGDNFGFNPLAPGDDDMVVTVAETRLPGARDFLLAPVIHRDLMSNPRLQECTLCFLRHGYFVAEAARKPIEAEQGAVHVSRSQTKRQN